MPTLTSSSAFQPLAMRMRPQTLEEFAGQEHLLTKGKPIFNVVQSGRLHSMIFWGPPGTGKTTLAHIIANAAHAHVEKLSAVLAGVKDIRDIVQKAKERLESEQKKTVLFVDEVHRFNKAQQDAFLPHVEAGTIILIGATTENPSFQLNNALLSRTRVYVLKPLQEKHLYQVLENALKNKTKGFGERCLVLSQSLKEKIIASANGDARQVLNLLEILVDFAEEKNGEEIIPEEAAQEVFSHSVRRFDNHGEIFYDQISALHKSVRGSDPNAALYWFARMLDGGCDPHYIARRVVRMASEDIGNADPRGLSLAVAAWETYDRLGSPEGELAIAQAIVYLTCAPKSNAVYTAFNHAMADAESLGNLEVPLYLRNAPTNLMKSLGYGKGYRYAHDESDAFAKGVKYFPEEMEEKIYYYPTDRGLEIKIKEKLDFLRQENKKHK